MEEEQDSSSELLTKRRYSLQFWLWAKKYWGGSSTGVRNWLLIAGIAVAVILLLLAPAIGPALPAAVLLGLLIGVGVIASISLAAAMIATVRAAMLDYAEYQKIPRNISYFRHLFNKFVDWIKDHPLNSMLILSLLVIAPLVAIPGLIGLSAVAILMQFGLLFSITAITDGICRFFDYLFLWCLRKISGQSESNSNSSHSHTSHSYKSEDATTAKPTSYTPQPGSPNNSVQSSSIWKSISEPLRLEPNSVAIISNPNNKKIEVREVNLEDGLLKPKKKQYDSTANEVIIPCLASKAIVIISSGTQRVIINVARSQHDNPSIEFWTQLLTNSDKECSISIFQLAKGFNYTGYLAALKNPYNVQISDFDGTEKFKFNFNQAQFFSNEGEENDWQAIGFNRDSSYYYKM